MRLFSSSSNSSATQSATHVPSMETPRSRKRSCISRSAGHVDQGKCFCCPRGVRLFPCIPKSLLMPTDARAWLAYRAVARAMPGRYDTSVPETSRSALNAPGAYASLRIPDFRRFIIGLFAFTIAIQIQGTVVGWQVYELTHDKLALGLIGLAEAVPFIGAALYAGHVADRHDRRRVTLAALVLLVACAAMLFLLALLVRSNVLLPGIYAVIVASGLGRSFLMPARQALGAELVPRSEERRVGKE